MVLKILQKMKSKHQQNNTLEIAAAIFLLVFLWIVTIIIVIVVMYKKNNSDRQAYVLIYAIDLADVYNTKEIIKYEMNLSK